MSLSYDETYQESQQAFRDVLTMQFALHGNASTTIKAFFASKGIVYKSLIRESAGHSLEIIQIKYRQDCSFDELWMFACRGVTVLRDHSGVIPLFLEEPARTFGILSINFCFNKFFNVEEIPSKLRASLTDLTRGLETKTRVLRFTLKEDGSNLKTFYDPFGGVHSLTLGSNDSTFKMQPQLEESPTFNSESLRLLERDYPEILEWLQTHVGWSLVSELKTKWNQIVTVYKTECNQPLCFIDPDGRPRWAPLRRLCPQLFTADGWPLHSWPTSTATLEQDFADYLQWLKANPELVGIYPEGAVMYACQLDEDGKPDMVVPMSKHKNPDYKDLHRKMSINFGTENDLRNCQLAEVNSIYDDQVTVGSSLRDDHIAKFRLGMRTAAAELDKVLPSLIAARELKKDYAEIVKALPDTVEWMKPFLFRGRLELTDTTEAMEFIYSQLRANNGDALFKLNKARGSLWWQEAPPEEETKESEPVTAAAIRRKVLAPTAPVAAAPALRPNTVIVFCDFDGTLRDEGAKSPDYVANPTAVNIIRAYHDMEVKIVILTGRSHLESLKLSAWCASVLGFEVKMSCRPSESGILAHKMSTLASMLTEDIGTVVHLENDVGVLNECAKICGSRKIRYLGHLFENDRLTRLVTKSTPSILVSLCDTMGTGKTSIFKLVTAHYDALGVPVKMVSGDLIFYQWQQRQQQRPTLDIHGQPLKVMPKELKHDLLMKAFATAVSCGGVGLIDMTNRDASMIKKIKDHPHVLGTFMKLGVKNTKKGPAVCIDPKYLAFAEANVTARLAARDAARLNGDDGIAAMNGSTLDCVDAVEVTRKTADDCVRQILSRDITQYAKDRDDIIGVEEAAKLLIADIELERAKTLSADEPFAYLGVPTPVSEASMPPNFYNIKYPHLTIRPPSKQLDAHLDKLGRAVRYHATESPLPELVDGEVDLAYHTRYHPAIMVDTPEAGLQHITRHVRVGHQPFEARAELNHRAQSLSAEALSEFIQQISTGEIRTGYMVLM
jgi:hypothetical protein